MSRREISAYNWSWLGFFLGPFYLFICGAYLVGAIVLGVNFTVSFMAILLFSTTKFTLLINLATMIFCGINAEKIVSKPMKERHDHYLGVYRKKGYEGRELVKIVQKRSMGFGRIIGGALLSLFMYYTSKFVLTVFMTIIYAGVT